MIDAPGDEQSPDVTKYKYLVDYINDGVLRSLSTPSFIPMALIYLLLQFRHTRLTNNLTFVFGCLSGVSTKCASRSIFLKNNFFPIYINLNRILHLNPKNSAKFNWHDDATQLIKLSNYPSSFQVPNSPLVIYVCLPFIITHVYTIVNI